MTSYRDMRKVEDKRDTEAVKGASKLPPLTKAQRRALGSEDNVQNVLRQSHGSLGEN